MVKQSVQRVIDALQAAGIEADIHEMSASTRTAEEAAAAIGTTVPRIVKSLVFLAEDAPILALVSGSNRLDTDRLGVDAGTRVVMKHAREISRQVGKEQAIEAGRTGENGTADEHRSRMCPKQLSKRLP